MKDRAQPTIQGLRILLERLDPENLRAAEKYYRLLGVLTLFLENRIDCPADFDDLARKALDIVSEKLAEGENIENIQAYSFGVARNLLSAYRRKTVHTLMDDAILTAIPDARPIIQETITKEIEEECRQKCLQSLSPEKRNLIIRYYQRGLHSKDYKEQMARELQTTVEALGNRISRIKKKLGECRLGCIRTMRDSTTLWH